MAVEKYYDSENRVILARLLIWVTAETDHDVQGGPKN